MTAALLNPTAAPTMPDAKRSTYLPFVDGLRGLAALYVVVFHVYRDYAGTLPRYERILFGWARLFGHEAVDLFIVISGYCLAMPVLNGKPVAPGRFMVRRAKRILPPYYFAVLVFLLATLLSTDGLHWARGLGASASLLESFNPANLLAHLTLLHNWSPRWKISLAGPFWSVATEFQIYLAYVLVLVPLWKRFGLATATVAGWLIGLLPLALVHGLDWCCPWYLGLFTLGIWAAKLGNPSPRPTRLKSWFAAAVGLLVIAIGLKFVPLDTDPRLAASDAVWGLAAAAWLAALTRLSATRAGSGGAGSRVPLLESRPVVWLGTISYTLYLQHTVLLMELRPLVNALHLRRTLELPLMFAVVVPLVVLSAWVLWWLVERPSLLWRDRRSPTVQTRVAIGDFAPSPSVA